jgi:hypothetical protein
MREPGMRVLVALLDGQHAGFLCLLPIEVAPAGPAGKNLAVIQCLTVREGIKGHSAAGGDTVLLREYSADDPAIRARYGIYRAILIDSNEVSWGYEAPKGACARRFARHWRGVDAWPRTVPQPRYANSPTVGCASRAKSS